MPPKRKVPKAEENIAKVGDEKVSKAKKYIEASSRTLRARPSVTSPEPAKTSKTNTSGKTAKKGANGIESTTKAPAKAKRGGKKKAEQSDKEEPAEKQSKLTIIEKEDNEPENEPIIDATSLYDFTAKDINGQLLSLDKYKGHVCIIVNVASRCGHTSSNYKEFVDIYDKYNEEKGLKILAFPCNQFGKQEPGDNEKICEFAKKRNVKFDMFEKIDVNGKNAHPLWKFLTNQKVGPKGNRIEWNFTKFLIDKEGQVVERFKPAIKPSALVKELEKLW